MAWLAPRRLVLTLAAAGLVGLADARPASGQLPGTLGVELRAGAAVGAFAPTRAGLELVPGPAWGVALTWGPSPALGAYAAFASIGFGCEGGLCQGYDVSLTSRGASLGVRAEPPIPGAAWIRAGLVLHWLEERWTGGESPGRATRGPSPGVEGAAGLSWMVTDRLSVDPGLHLGFLATRSPEGIRDDVFFSVLEVGLRFRL